MKKLSDTFLITHPILGMTVLSVGLSLFGSVWNLRGVLSSGTPTSVNTVTALFLGTALLFLLIFPVVITVYNIGYLFVPRQSEITKKRGRAVEYLTLIYGGVCTFFYTGVGGLFSREIVWGSHWSDQLYNDQLHSPVSTKHLPTVIVLCVIALAGYILLRAGGIGRLPPIPAALSIGGLYLGIFLCTLWIIQFISGEILFCVYPLNLILISAKLIREAAEEWRETEREIPEGKSSAVTAVYSFVARSNNLPWLGFLAALPLLGVCIAFLALFGQAPDSIIRAWTETADWTMSNHVGPQNIIYDEHYLCTVAAGGHRKVVKPIRTGKRHGHEVIVNRQLCVANAFEGLLQERLPRFHKAVRRFYDRYGYPVARYIRSPYAADAVWIMMKPLEWLFLLVLYTFDRKPENRIAVQYPHKAPPKI